MMSRPFNKIIEEGASAAELRVRPLQDVLQPGKDSHPSGKILTFTGLLQPEGMMRQIGRPFHPAERNQADLARLTHDRKRPPKDSTGSTRIKWRERTTLNRKA